ncbi:MAG: tetratricopeptide repeat protein [Leptolyngbyaceae cyanobacterium]
MAVRFSSSSRILWRWLGSGVLAVGLIGGVTSAATAQESESSPVETPSEVRRIDSVATSEFSVPYADQLVAEATTAIANQNYTVAIDKFNEARELYNQLSLYYQELAEMFFGVDTRQNRSNRDKAIEAAQKRDEATYQLALIHRSQDAPEEAIPLLMEVLRSQQPTRDLGEQAYQQLFELGFVEAPYEFN